MSAPLAYFGGVTRQTVSDNLKAGIIKASFHEPLVNRTYADLAQHYGTAIVQRGLTDQRDKAKVEVGVQVVGRGSWRGCGTSAFSRWSNSTRRSAPCSTI